MAEAVLHIQLPNEFSGKQVLIKSDRLVFNAATNDIILAAKGTIALAANDQIHINSKSNLYLNVEDGAKIVVGKSGSKTRKSEQPAVMGTSLQTFLEDLMQLLVTFGVTTPSGEGQASPRVNTEIQKFKRKYFSKNSKDYILSDLLFIADNKK
jgi:hypothetical protein